MIRNILLIVIAGIVINAAAILRGPEGIICQFTDSMGYGNYALNLVSGYGYFLNPGVAPSGRAPVYPLILASVYSLFGHSPTAQKILEMIFLLAVGVLTYLIGKKVFSDIVGFIAGLVVVVNPDLRMYLQCQMSEITFMFLIMVGLHFLLLSETTESSNKGLFSAIGGSVLGLAALSRPSFYLFPFVYVIGKIIMIMLNKITGKGEQGNRTKMSVVMIMLLFYCSTLTPWIVRNSTIYHKVSGIVENKGAYPLLYVGIEETVGNSWLSNEKRRMIESQPSLELRNKLAQESAIKYRIMNILKSWQIYREFWSFRLSQKIGYLIGDNRMLDFKFDVLLIPLGILGFIIAIFKNRLNYKEYGLIAFALYLNAIHVMFCGDPRYRIPLVPILSLYSSYLLVLAAGTILGNQKK